MKSGLWLIMLGLGVGMAGAAEPRGGARAVAAEETEAAPLVAELLVSPEVGLYRGRLHQLAQERWAGAVARLPEKTPSGRVVMRVRLKRDGAVEDIVCVEGREHRELAALGKRVLKGLNGSFRPFSPEMRAQVGDMLEERVVFRYHNSRLILRGS